MNYFGDAAGFDRSAGGSSSTRKGKKSHPDKPKQPQRGLGVAQLEKIRLHSQLGLHPTNLPQEHIRIQTAYSPSSSFSYNSSSASYNTSQGQQNIMVCADSDVLNNSCNKPILMGIVEPERSNMIYGHAQLSSDPSNAMFEAQLYVQPGITRHLFQVEVEDSLRTKNMNNSMGSRSQNYDSNGSQEVDLELRLSL
ncbi:SPEAR3-like protein [Tanacetum coccineum]